MSATSRYGGNLRSDFLQIAVLSVQVDHGLKLIGLAMATVLLTFGLIVDGAGDGRTW